MKKELLWVLVSSSFMIVFALFLFQDACQVTQLTLQGVMSAVLFLYGLARIVWVAHAVKKED
ncbi:MAG: hypothetical protein HFE68_06405 [Erysipelotrichaceae bacterium]|nr:hypothetical protein [Erysipelotrichaceae bacterium]MCI9312978.1 hypothetical protein [Erysipelotrichaceae bacterium]